MHWSARVLPIIVLALAASMTAGLEPARGQQATVPPAALILAQRLHVTGTPFVGNQPQGNFGPWLLWGQPDLSTSRHILSIGPAGARGQFDYFAPSALPQRGGPDSGPPLPNTIAVHIARSWLAQAGVALPPVHTFVTRTHSTLLGGTGAVRRRGAIRRSAARSSSTTAASRITQRSQVGDCPVPVMLWLSSSGG